MATGAVIGIDRLAVWPVTANTELAYTCGTVTELSKKLMTAQDTPTISEGELSACNQVVTTNYSIDGGDLAIGLTDLSSTDRVLFYDETVTLGTNVTNKNDLPGDVCVAYMTNRDDGKVNLYKFPSAKFSPQAESFETKKKGATNYQTTSMKGKYIPTLKDGNARYARYAVDPVTDAAVITAWFLTATYAGPEA